MGGYLVALSAMSTVMSMVPAATRAAGYGTNWLFPNIVPDPATSVELLRRRMITSGQYVSNCRYHGYSKENAEWIYKISHRMLDVSDLVKLKYRGQITETEYLAKMKVIGIQTEEANRLLDSNMTILSPTDIAVLKRRNKITDAEFNQFMSWVGVDSDLREHYTQLLSMELSPDEIITLFRRNLITLDQYNDYLSRIGYTSEQGTQLIESRAMLLNPTDLVVLFWRGEISSEEYFEEMFALGFGIARATQFEERMKFYPSAQDLITWTAKEVFEPDAIEKYGLLDELELLRTEDFAKAGITEEQVKNYWIAHWEHPNFNAIREMYFRSKTPAGVRKLGYDDIYEWFRLVEIPPYWRDKFIDIMHEPFTRVDVRRMHAMGVLNDQQVVEAYMELGYDRWKAEKLLEFTIAYNLPAERDLSRTMLEKSYEYGEIDRDTFVGYLVEMGYNRFEADLIVTLFEIRLGQEDFDMSIDTIMTQFKNGVLTQEQVINELNSLGVKGSYRDNLIAKTIREKQATFKLPTKEDILTWFVFKRIDLETTKDYLDRLGYRKVDVDHYVDMAVESLSEKERSELGIE